MLLVFNVRYTGVASLGHPIGIVSTTRGVYEIVASRKVGSSGLGFVCAKQKRGTFVVTAFPIGRKLGLK